MSEKGCSCGCSQSREAQFRELAPVLEQYAKVPGSLITILQKTQDIYGYLSVDAINYISEVTGIKACEDLWCGYFLRTVQTEACRQISDHALSGYCVPRKRLGDDRRSCVRIS